MTREGLKKHWEVVEAYKNGAAIQLYSTCGKWVDVLNAETFSASAYCEYRIKPKTFDCGVLGELSEDELKILWHRVNCAGSDFDDAYVKASLDDFPNLGKIENRPMKCRDLFIKIENVLSK